MEVLDLKKVKESELIKIISSALLSSKVVVLPTETIPGLSCRADDLKAIEKIFAIKKRNKNKPLLVLVSSISMLKKYCFVSLRQEKILKNLWSKKRAISVLLNHRSLLPKELTANSEYLAVRLPKSSFLRKIIKSVGVPLVSTSFNISGSPLLTMNEAKRVFEKNLGPDYLLLGNKNSYKKASRLIKLGEDSIEVLRK